MALTSRTYNKSTKNFTWVAFHKDWEYFFFFKCICAILTRTSRTYKKKLKIGKKNKTCGRRFWHWLHGLQMKVQKFHLVGLLQAVRNVFSSNLYVAFWHGLHGLRENIFLDSQNFTCGRRFWHWLHGLRIKVVKFLKGWPFRSITEYFFFSNSYMAFGHGLHGLRENIFLDA